MTFLSKFSGSYLQKWQYKGKDSYIYSRQEGNIAVQKE